MVGLWGRSTTHHEAPALEEWARMLRGAVLILGLGLGLIVGRIVWFDAYWIFRESPPWLQATGGASRLLDRQTRRAKVLQGMSRRYRVALVGSSTVYHGLDPNDAGKNYRGQIFNAGISALLADELPLVAAIVAARADVERVVIGLDYYMFSRSDVPVRLSPSLQGRLGRWNTWLGSLLSEYALRDSSLWEVAGSEDPGSWTYQGFRITPKQPPDLTRLNDAVRRRTTTAYRPETLGGLKTALIRLAGRRVEIYIAPISEAQRRVLSDKGLLADFARWKADVGRVAAAAGVSAVDFTDLGAAFPFSPEEGSTEGWLDNLHFTPLIGRMIFERLGLGEAEVF